MFYKIKKKKNNCEVGFAKGESNNVSHNVSLAVFSIRTLDAAEVLPRLTSFNVQDLALVNTGSFLHSDKDLIRHRHLAWPLN